MQCLITARNRLLLIAPCEDPRTHGSIQLPDGQAVGLGFGVVMAMDDTPPMPQERVRPDIKLGDIVYARDGAAQSVVVDGDKIWSFVNEFDVMGVRRGVKAKLIEIQPRAQGQEILQPR